MSTEHVQSNLRSAQRQRTEERILTDAAALFLDRGYRGTTVRAIAESAGVSVGRVMAVGDKDALLIACYDRWIARSRRARTRFRTLARNGRPPRRSRTICSGSSSRSSSSSPHTRTSPATTRPRSSASTAGPTSSPDSPRRSRPRAGQPRLDRDQRTQCAGLGGGALRLVHGCALPMGGQRHGLRRRRRGTRPHHRLPHPVPGCAVSAPTAVAAVGIPSPRWPP